MSALAMRNTASRLSRPQGATKTYPRVARVATQKVFSFKGGSADTRSQDPDTTMKLRKEKMFNYIDKEADMDYKRGIEDHSDEAKVSYTKEDQAGAENRQVNKAFYYKKYKNQEGDAQVDPVNSSGRKPSNLAVPLLLGGGLLIAYLTYNNLLG